ncbi:hypothetical protein A45J_1597 [hot springs metagenome]|uniref:Uncharacterized protein n=1 Tax=hot springs metagenome TaxID=433727 RepID=A0A5J4L4T6_9ZZZZ
MLVRSNILLTKYLCLLNKKIKKFKDFIPQGIKTMIFL